MGTRPDLPNKATFRQRFFRHRLLLGFGVFLVFALTLLVFLNTLFPQYIPASADNPQPAGGRAVAQVLSEQGVNVVSPESPQAALSNSGPDTTLLVINPGRLSPEDFAKLTETGADLVMFGRLGMNSNSFNVTEEIRQDMKRSLVARCSDPDADAAHTISSNSNFLFMNKNSDMQGCFPGSTGSAYMVGKIDGTTVRLIADETLITNSVISKKGNAALVLRALGHNQTLVWYVVQPGDTFGSEKISKVSLLPPALTYCLLLFCVVACVAAVWKGRRLGRLVVDNSPVIVPAAETVRGRAQLYSKTKDYPHLASVLREGTARRCATYLGIPLYATRSDLVSNLSHSSTVDEVYIDNLFYGPSPNTDSELSTLAQDLTIFENKIHRLRTPGD